MNDHIFLIVKVIVSLENLQTKISDTGHPIFMHSLSSYFFLKTLSGLVLKCNIFDFQEHSLFLTITLLGVGDFTSVTGSWKEGKQH